MGADGRVDAGKRGPSRKTLRVNVRRVILREDLSASTQLFDFPVNQARYRELPPNRVADTPRQICCDFAASLMDTRC